MKVNGFFFAALFLLSSCVSTPQPTPHEAKQSSQVESITIAAAGDVFMAGTAQKILDEKGYDASFQPTQHLLDQADIAVANLEGAITSGGTAYADKTYVFRMSPEHVAPALKKAGIDLVTLANNHIMDYGVVGLEDTKKILEEHDIATMGAGLNEAQARVPYIFKKGDYSVGFLAYSLTFPEEFWASDTQAGTAFAYEEKMREDIQALKSQVDSIVVSFHWGRELETELRPYQTRMGHIAIDQGASLVIGHHPHIMQGIERYKNGLILHSLGNYVFGSYSNKVQFGGLAQIQLNRLGFERLEMSLIDVNNFRRDFQPIVLEGKAFDQAFKDIELLSKPLNTVVQQQGNKLIVE